MKKKLLGYYDYTVIFTYCGMLFGYYGILQTIRQEYSHALFCLMMAGFCDMFDGTIAATKTRTDREKRFGIQIDSLSDLVSFGVLPGMFIYILFDKNALVGLITSLFALCALIRLAYFNVIEEDRQKQTIEKRKEYSGIPVTTIAVMLPIVYLLYDYRLFQNRSCFLILLCFMGAGFLLPVKIKKPGLAGKAGIVLLGIIEALGVIFLGLDVM